VWLLPTCIYILVLIILLLSHSATNCRSRTLESNLYHFASNLLRHYLAKFHCSTVHLFIRITRIICTLWDVKFGLSRQMFQSCTSSPCTYLLPSLGCLIKTRPRTSYLLYQLLARTNFACHNYHLPSGSRQLEVSTYRQSSNVDFTVLFCS